MADSFSTLLNLRLQQTGGNTNTWGDLLSTDTIAPLEKAIAGTATHAVTGGTLDLSASPMIEQVHVFSGALSSNQLVIVPNLSKRMIVSNGTSGAFVLQMKIPSGSLCTIPQGGTYDIIMLGSGGNVYRMDAPEIGEIKHFGGSTVPAGYLECDGSAISRADYGNLFSVIGTLWGAGNGSTTFNLPDLKTAGRFLRSRTGSVAAGTIQAADIAAHNHTATATATITSLSIAADGIWTPTISIDEHGGHAHGYIYPSNAVGGSSAAPVSSVFVANNAGVTSAATTGITASSSIAPAHTHSGSTGTATATVTVNNSTGVETRPVNASALACIRY